MIIFIHNNSVMNVCFTLILHLSVELIMPVNWYWPDREQGHFQWLAPNDLSARGVFGRSDIQTRLGWTTTSGAARTYP